MHAAWRSSHPNDSPAGRDTHLVTHACYLPPLWSYCLPHHRTAWPPTILPGPLPICCCLAPSPSAAAWPPLHLLLPGPLPICCCLAPSPSAAAGTFTRPAMKTGALSMTRCVHRRGPRLCPGTFIGGASSMARHMHWGGLIYDRARALGGLIYDQVHARCMHGGAHMKGACPPAPPPPGP